MTAYEDAALLFKLVLSLNYLTVQCEQRESVGYRCSGLHSAGVVREAWRDADTYAPLYSDFPRKAV